MKIAETLQKMFPKLEKKELDQLFNMAMNSELAQITGKIDILVIDDYIHKVYGTYEDDNLSLKEFLIKNFGEEVYNVLK